MTGRSIRNEWQRLWRILTNPTVEVLAALVLVLVACWIIADTRALPHVPHVPVFSAQ